MTLLAKAGMGFVGEAGVGRARETADAGYAGGLLDEDDVLPKLMAWREQALRTALVTLVGVEGGAPRSPGAQMAVAEDGRYAGYLSGGCLEQAVALEAKDVIVSGRNRLIRYGKDSPYFDIKLPCGSGLDLYFDQALGDVELRALLEHRSARRNAVLQTALEQGTSVVSVVEGPVPASGREAGVFRRVYPATLNLLLIGVGPGLVAIAELARTMGLDLAVWSTDEATRAALIGTGIKASAQEEALDAAIAGLDASSATVVVYHDHEAEPRILAKLLDTPSYYVGVLGNHAVHRARLVTLADLGFSEDQLARLRAPVGSIPNAKSKATLAIGVLAELMADAKARNLVP